MNILSPVRFRPQVRRPASKSGQALVEYALILSFISVLTIFIMSSLGVELQNVYVPIINALDTARQSLL